MPKKKVSEDQIREAAYHLWREEGEPQGQDQDIWYRAESDLTAPKPKRKPAAKRAAKPAAKTAAAPKAAAAKKPAAKRKPAAKKTAKA